jgi:hypothetical protein
MFKAQDKSLSRLTVWLDHNVKVKRRPPKAPFSKNPFKVAFTFQMF